MAACRTVASALAGDGVACEAGQESSQSFIAKKSYSSPGMVLMQETAMGKCCDDEHAGSTSITVLLQCSSCNLCSCQWTSDGGISCPSWHWTTGMTADGIEAPGGSACFDDQGTHCNELAGTVSVPPRDDLQTKLHQLEEQFHGFESHVEDTQRDLDRCFALLEEVADASKTQVTEGAILREKLEKLDMLEHVVRALQMQFRTVMNFSCMDGSPQCENSELLSKWNQHEAELLKVQTWICLNSAKVDAFAKVDLLGIKARLDGIEDRCRKEWQCGFKSLQELVDLDAYRIGSLEDKMLTLPRVG